MDKFKEKVAALKVERDEAVARLEALKEELKTAQEELASKEEENSTLTKKAS
nr:9_t:CDS:2 [Entrophospora candida]